MKPLITLIERFIPNKRIAARLAEALLDEGYLTLKPDSTEVELILSAFKSSYGTTNTNQRDRFSASRLSRKYPAREIVSLIKVLAEHQGDKYCPSVGSIYQLEQKWVSVKRFVSTLAYKTDIEI